MSGVDGDTVVLLSSACSDIRPVSVLLSKIKSSRVGDKDESDDPTGESKPANDPELGVIVDIVVNHRRHERTEFTRRSGKTVCSSSDTDREDFSREKEGGTVGTELLEE